MMDAGGVDNDDGGELHAAMIVVTVIAGTGLFIVFKRSNILD